MKKILILASLPNNKSSLDLNVEIDKINTAFNELKETILKK